jgi:hypothetical protein
MKPTKVAISNVEGPKKDEKDSNRPDEAISSRGSLNAGNIPQYNAAIAMKRPVKMIEVFL